MVYRSPVAAQLIAPLSHSLLLLQSPPLSTQRWWSTGRRSPPSSIGVLWTALYKAGEGDGSLPRGRLSTVPCVRFYIEGRGRLSTVPFVRFHIAQGGRTARYRPLCSVLYSREGGTALYRPLCSVLRSAGARTALYRPLWSVFNSRGGGRLSTVPYVRFYIGIYMAFRGGDGVRYPPSVGRVEVE